MSKWINMLLLRLEFYPQTPSSWLKNNLTFDYRVLGKGAIKGAGRVAHLFVSWRVRWQIDEIDWALQKTDWYWIQSMAKKLHIWWDFGHYKMIISIMSFTHIFRQLDCLRAHNLELVEIDIDVTTEELQDKDFNQNISWDSVCARKLSQNKMSFPTLNFLGATVDGWNPAPVEVGSFFPLFLGVSAPSQVVQCRISAIDGPCPCSTLSGSGPLQASDLSVRWQFWHIMNTKYTWVYKTEVDLYSKYMISSHMVVFACVLKFSSSDYHV